MPLFERISTLLVKMAKNQYKFYFGKESLIDPLFLLRGKYLGNEKNVKDKTPSELLEES